MPNHSPRRLIAAATAVQGEYRLRKDFFAASVGAALSSAAGKLYTGVCMDLACGVGFCAEHAAVAEMLKDRETRIHSVVAVGDDGEILPPCGRCRELMLQLDTHNADTRVILGPRRQRKLIDLLPEHWL